MQYELELKSGIIPKGEVVEINLKYFVATEEFNLYAEAANCRYSYPDISMDQLAEFLVAIGRGFTLGLEKIDGKKVIVKYKVNQDREVVPFDDPIPLEECQWMSLIEEEAECRSFMVDAYSPKPGCIQHLLDLWPAAYGQLSSQQMAFAAALLDRIDTRDSIFSFIQAAGVGMSKTSLDKFVKRIEHDYAMIRINRQISEVGYTVIGRGHTDDGDPAVLYTLGLYDSKEGRDILLISEERLDSHANAFKEAARLLNDNHALDEVNEKLKFYWTSEYKYRLVIRNIKSAPKHAFEYQNDDLPVKGVFTLMV